MRSTSHSLDGQMCKDIDGLWHIGPNVGLPLWSPLWSTRCGKDGKDILSAGYDLVHVTGTVCEACQVQGGVQIIGRMPTGEELASRRSAVLEEQGYSTGFGTGLWQPEEIK